MPKTISNQQIKFMRELYKSHHRIKEASRILDMPYSTVAAAFRGFEMSGIEKYNRIFLSPVLAKELESYIN
jgi:hypothetical protein